MDRNNDLTDIRKEGEDMIKRLLNCSPREMMALTSRELFEAIKMSEGRTVIALARLRGPNLVQYVSGPEMCAAFGADIVRFNGYNPREPIFPGLPSKEKGERSVYRDVQITLGKGWTAREVKELIGRPIATHLVVPPSIYGAEKIDTGTASETEDENNVAGGTCVTEENIRLVVQQGFDILAITGHGASQEDKLKAIRKIKEIAKDKLLIEAGVAHGPGLIYAKDAPMNLREIFTPDMAAEMVEAGADIIQYPAVGSLPGFTPEYCGKIIDAVHEAGALAMAGIHNSQEGADIETVKRIAIDNKIIGSDMYTIGDAALNENMADPRVIMALCIAVKGMRHTYRRMSESVLR